MCAPLLHIIQTWTNARQIMADAIANAHATTCRVVAHAVSVQMGGQTMERRAAVSIHTLRMRTSFLAWFLAYPRLHFQRLTTTRSTDTSRYKPEPTQIQEEDNENTSLVVTAGIGGAIAGLVVAILIVIIILIELVVHKKSPRNKVADMSKPPISESSKLILVTPRE